MAPIAMSGSTVEARGSEIVGQIHVLAWVSQAARGRSRQEEPNGHLTAAFNPLFQCYSLAFDFPVQ